MEFNAYFGPIENFSMNLGNTFWCRVAAIEKIIGTTTLILS